MADRAPTKTRGRRGDAPAEEKPAGRTRQRGTDVATTKGGRGNTNVTDIEKQMAEQAEAATNMERGAPMGRNFSFKGGQMVFDGAPIKDNEVIVIVAAAVIEKAYYEGDYDPDLPEPPICFAFDTDPDNLAPIPEDVADLQNDACHDCQWNKFGSADRGKGKACKDVRRLALIPAGTIERNGDLTLIEDPKELQKAEFGFAKLPPTSLTAFSAFVRQVANTMKRPPHGIYAIMKCVPDAKNQFTIAWEAIDLVDKKCLPAVMERHDEAMKAIMQPYTYPSDEERADRKKQAKGRGGRAAPKDKPAGRGAKDDKPQMRQRSGGGATGRGSSGAAPRSRKY